MALDLKFIAANKKQKSWPADIVCNVGNNVFTFYFHGNFLLHLNK